MADEKKMQPAGEPEKTQAASSAQHMAVDPGARISELVAEFDKAKIPFAKLEPLLPQVKTTSGENHGWILGVESRQKRRPSQIPDPAAV